MRFCSRGEQRRRKRFWPAVPHLTTLRGQARRFLSLSKIIIIEIKNKQEKILAFLSPGHSIIASINSISCSCLTCGASAWRESVENLCTVDHGADGKLDIRAFVPFNQSCIQPSSEKAPIQKVHSTTSHSGKCFSYREWPMQIIRRMRGVRLVKPPRP